MIYAYSGILYNNENERPLHIKHGWIIKTMLKRNKMQKNYILYDLFYMESIKAKYSERNVIIFFGVDNWERSKEDFWGADHSISWFLW